MITHSVKETRKWGCWTKFEKRGRGKQCRGLHETGSRNSLPTMSNKHTNHEMDYSSEYTKGLFFSPYYSLDFLSDVILVVYDDDFSSSVDDNIIHDVIIHNIIHDVRSNLYVALFLQEKLFKCFSYNEIPDNFDKKCHLLIFIHKHLCIIHVFCLLFMGYVTKIQLAHTAISNYSCRKITRCSHI